MGSIGPLEVAVIALIALLLFGAGRIADIGKGLGQGIKNFKAGLKDDEQEAKAEKAEKGDKSEKAERAEKNGKKAASKEEPKEEPKEAKEA